MMSIRKWIILPLVFLLIIQLPIPLFGSEKAATAANLETPKISLEQALQNVKSNFQVPTDYTEFTSGFSSYNANQVWSLNWNASGGNGGSFSAQVDAVSGEILSVYSWPSSQNDMSYTLPKLSLAEAKQIAETTVKKLTGQKYTHLKFLLETNLVPINLYGATTYEFRWQRVENGVPLQGNLVTVQINAANGQVATYNMVWNDLAIPEVKNIIPAKKAMDAVNSSKLLELQYFLSPIYKPLIAGSHNENVQLVYQLKNNATIDAFSGQTLNLNTDQWLSKDSALGGMGNVKKDTEQAVILTPEEQKELAANAKLLTREKALETVKQWVTIPSTVTMKSINLYQDYYQRNGKVWAFEWGSAENSLAQSISARINAESGELVSFNIYSPETTDANTAKITAAQAQKVAQDYIKKIASEKFGQLKLNQDANIKDVKILQESTSLMLTYERVVNGILFTSNNITITVDLLTGKITSYNLTWWNLNFPQLSLAISQSQAHDKLFTARPMVLQYVILYEQGTAKEVRLVYKPSTENKLTSDLMDAKTGAFLDYQGNPMKEQPQPHSFIDIAGIPAEKEITILGLAGLFGEYGSKFEPSKDITAISLLRALYSAKNGTATNLSDEEVIKQAKREGWIVENLVPSQTINRLLFSKIVIRYLGLEKVATVSDIYNSTYADVPKDSLGYVSLLTGLGIMKVDGSSFDTSANVSRSEAAYSLVRVLEIGFRS